MKTGSVVIIVLALSGLTAFAFPSLENGDFSEPNLAGWTIVSDPFIDVCGVALFQQDLDDYSSALSQAFIFPAGAQTLSFDIEMTSMGAIGLGCVTWPRRRRTL